MDDIRKYRMKTLAFIPARAGSVGIKNKNLALLGDRPLYQWALEAALSTQGIDHTVLSTDIQGLDLSHLSRENSFEVHKRPRHLRDGLSYRISSVVKNYLKNAEEEYDLVALFQPTSPFVRPEHVEGLLRGMKENRVYNSAQTICRIPHNYHYQNQREIKGESVDFCFSTWGGRAPRKQDKPTVYKFGNMVVIKTGCLSIRQDMFPLPSFGLEVNWKHAIDIDTQEDLDIANLLYGMELV